jgi:hypothetical protein
LRGKGAPMTQKPGGREQRRGGGSQTGAGGAGTEGSQGELVRMSKVDGIHVIGRGCCHRGCCDGRTGGPARVSLRTGRRLCSLRWDFGRRSAAGAGMGSGTGMEEALRFQQPYLCSSQSSICFPVAAKQGHTLDLVSCVPNLGDLLGFV